MRPIIGFVLTGYPLLPRYHVRNPVNRKGKKGERSLIAAQKRETERPPIAETTSPIEYHADDFGLFPTQSMRILDCHTAGVLNGVSVMPNSENLSECMALLSPFREEIEITIHLNLIEGRSLCSPMELPFLVDRNGIFRVSFGSLMLHSYLPGKAKYRKQLQKEIRAQIGAIKQFLPNDSCVRIDGHAHYHMLPVVFDALMDVIREDHLKVSYIRIPREHLSLYLRNWKKLHNFSAINLVKVLILNLLAVRNERKYRPYLSPLTQKVFLGVFLSGHMDRENVAAILPDAIRFAKEQNCGIEILAHPGGIYEKADIAKLTNSDDIAFLTSESRRRESAMFQSLGTEKGIL